ncbi:MAG: hypothetical protein M3O46_17680, partial [Myxococcota bacterium]|nr:hypothetical protein [Myxococcota bacterium]
MRDRWRIWAQGVFLVALLGCSSSRPPALGDTNGDPDASLGGPCSPGAAGCSCSMDGATVACGSVYIKTGTYVTCSMGRSACAGGVWGPCIGNVIVSKSLAPPPARTSGGLHFTALGTGGPCAAGSNPCDPNCNQTTDDPTSGFTAPAGFTAGPSGLSLSGTGGVACTGLTVTPSMSAVTVTDLTTPVPITLTATAVPAGCATSPYATTWTVDDADQATISGSMNNNGVLTLQTPLPGTMNVTAYAAGTTGTAVITIKLNIVDTTGIAPETASSATQYGKFYTGGVTTGAPLAGTTASTASWLYPYANAYLPLALPAPVVMYKYAVAPGTSPNSAIKLSLRYPAGATEAASIFNYATVVTELTPDPQVYTLQAAWQRFEQTARGTDASLVLQRWTGGGGGVLENETLRTIHFVDGQLKGTVFYQSYSSALGGNEGAILKIAPGATAPTLAVQPGGHCTVCHTLNSDGSKMIAQDGIPGGGSALESTAQRYNIAGGGAPSPPVLNTYANGSGNCCHDATGDKFDFGAPWMDGRLYMTHGGGATGDITFHAPPAASQLYDPANPATAKVVTGWANDEEATGPKFSPDGTKLAFGFWGGTGLAQSPSGTLASDVNGTTLAVVDFSCNAGCTANWAVANARALMTPATVAGYRPLTGGATFHVTNGSKNVTASGSLFTVELGGPPDKISFSAQPGVAYTVSAIGSDTALTLSANYTGATSTTSTAKNPALVSWPSFLPDGSAAIFQHQIVSSRAA